MKQIYLSAMVVLTAAFAFAQQPIITAIVDGPCTGGTPKLIELYAENAVDYTQFSLEKSANGGAFGSTFDLTPFGTRPAGSFVYVYTGTEATLNTEFPNIAAADYQSSAVANNNGDDAVRIVNTMSGTVIDMYGTQVDGTGETWEYLDSYATRNDGVSASATFSQANFDTRTPNSLDNLCSTSTSMPLNTVVVLGTYSPVASTTADITITSPANGAALNSGDFDVTFSVSNFAVAMSGGDGYIQFSLDNGAFTDKFDLTNISYSGVAPGAHTVLVQLVDNSGNVLSPAVDDSISFTVAAQQQAQDIADLRAAAIPTTDIFNLAGEVFITHTEGFRNQKWVQDSSGGILIDDPNGIITTTLVRGDGITGLSGTLSDFNGLLQFTPTQDPGAASSTGNMITPELVTLTQLNTNAEDYESEIIEISLVTFDNADGTVVFTNGVEEPISVGANTFTHRALFNTDYTGVALPTMATDLVGFIGQNNNGYFVSARDAQDVEVLSTSTVSTTSFKIYPNPLNGGILNIATDNGNTVNVTVYSTLGQQVFKSNQVERGINLDNLDAGIYLVKIDQGNASATRKLVIR